MCWFKDKTCTFFIFTWSSWQFTKNINNFLDNIVRQIHMEKLCNFDEMDSSQNGEIDLFYNFHIFHQVKNLWNSQNSWTNSQLSNSSLLMKVVCQILTPLYEDRKNNKYFCSHHGLFCSWPFVKFSIFLAAFMQKLRRS